jgi:transcriptional regulator with XRE-family HTH domain
VLRLVRRSRGNTLDELAAAANIDVGSLSRIERGLIKPRKDVLHLLSDALDVPGDELLTNPEVMP